MSKSQYRLPGIIWLLILMASPQAYAEEGERWYQVEVIIFSQTNPEYKDSELWPLDYTLPDLENSRELSPLAADASSQPASLFPRPFSLVPDERLQLGNTAERIKHASDVELVMHLGWLQPGLAEDKAVAVHIFDGMLSPETSSNTLTAAPSTETPPIQSLAYPKLDGTLKLILSRYLHLETDLVWRTPLPSIYGFEAEQPQIVGEAELASTSTVGEPAAMPEMPAQELDPFSYQVYRLQQSRRMRSNEVHYIDHPLFGIVAKVTRYEPTQLPDGSM